MTQLRSFIDRVLRLKAEQDTLTRDIREVYAEAKSSGFDKTAMGQLVAYLRKREKDPRKLEQNSALFETYLHDYEHGTPLATRTHAHEAETARVQNAWADHDPETGEIIEPAVAESAPAEQGRVGDSLHSSVALQAEPVQGVASEPAANAIEQVTAGSHFPSDDPGPLPDFLRRVA